MITVRIISDWEDTDHTHLVDTYELVVDQAYSPDVADDLVRRVLKTVAEDRADRRRNYQEDS